MALGFFRRRQKMVIIIMVVLMVSFLIGGYGVSTFFQPDPSKTSMGNSRFGALTLGELRSAEADIDVLRAIGLGIDLDRAQRWPLEMAFVQVVRGARENKAFETYALLLKEADAAGVTVSQHDVDDFFRSIGYADENAYKSLISSLRSGERGWTEQFIRGAVGTWLRIFNAYTDAEVNCPPSETELQVTWRDIKEQIGLDVVRLKAEDFIKGVPDPNQDVMTRQFKDWRSVYPNVNQQPDQMVGYMQPGRAMVQYMLLNGEVVGRVTEPSFDVQVDYFNHNKGEFFREVPVGPATKPADANSPATKPADANTPTIRVPLTFAEAKAKVIERLHDTAVRTRMDELTALVEKNVRLLLESSADPNTVYQKVIDGMMTPAGDMLAKPLKGLKIENVSLNDAIARLAGASKLAGICFPWGTHGDQTLVPSVKVTIVGDMTLREALDEVCRQVKWPRLEWAGCQTFNKVLFSVQTTGQGIDFFPLKVEQTPLWTYEQFAKDEVLGSCFANATGEGQSFAQTVFSAEGLTENPSQAAMIKLGEQGRRMYLVTFRYDSLIGGDKIGSENGRLLWRLTQVSPANVPQIMTPEIREQVVRDLKLAAAMKLAEKDAATIRDAAGTIGLATAAERKGLKVITTGLFSRLRLDMNMNMSWSVVPKLDELDTPALEAYFIPKAFELMPRNVDPNAPSGRPAVGVVPIPAKAEVLVIQRTGYRPVLRPEYEDARLEVAKFMRFQRRMLLQGAWFNEQNICLRLDYKVRGAAEHEGNILHE